MTALEAVAVHLPETTSTIEEVGDRLGLPSRQTLIFRRFHGLDRIRIDPAGTLEDLLRGTLEAARPMVSGRERQVKYILYATSLPVQVPHPHNPLQNLCREFGFEDALAFKVTHHACASGLLAVDVAGRLLASDADGDPDSLALVLTGEKTFTRDAQIAPETSIYAEGAAACLVRADAEHDRVLAYRAVLRGEYDGRLAEDHELLTEFNRAYPELFEEAIRSALAAAETSLDELKLILPHNANQISWRGLAKRMGYPLERILLENVAPNGHSFTADGFINLHTALEKGLLEPGDRYLIAAAGIGAVFSAMVLEH